MQRDSENAEAVIKAVVLAHHAYRQRVPDCFKPAQYVPPDETDSDD
jgi:hypothetical protein